MTSCISLPPINTADWSNTLDLSAHSKSRPVQVDGGSSTVVVLCVCVSLSGAASGHPPTLPANSSHLLISFTAAHHPHWLHTLQSHAAETLQQPSPPARPHLLHGFSQVTRCKVFLKGKVVPSEAEKLTIWLVDAATLYFQSFSHESNQQVRFTSL